MLLVGAFLFALAGSGLAGAGTDPETAATVLGFANHLFEQGEYYRAIGEYQRFLFLYPQHPRGPWAALQIARCYYLGQRWDDAIEQCRRIAALYPDAKTRAEARLLEARCLLAQDKLGAAVALLEKLLADLGQADLGQTELADRARYLLALTLARQRRWSAAEGVLGGISASSKISARAGSLERLLAAPPELRHKSPALAGLLAAVVPGAGHFYCERPADGALAFAYTGAFTWAAVEAFDNDHDELGVALGLIAGIIYAGNIFSAVNVAHKFNDYQQRQWRQRLEPYEKLELQLGATGGVSLWLTFRF